MCTDSTGCSVSVPTTIVLLDSGRLRSDEDEPNHMSSVFAAFSCSRREPHQSATSAIQCCRRSAMDCTCDGGADTYACVSATTFKAFCHSVPLARFRSPHTLNRRSAYAYDAGAEIINGDLGQKRISKHRHACFRCAVGQSPQCRLQGTVVSVIINFILFRFLIFSF